MLRTRPKSAGERLFVGSLDDLCLRFVDTLYWRGTDPPTETMGSMVEFTAWCVQTSVLDAADVVAVREWETRHHEDAVRLHREILEARERLYLLFSSVATDAPTIRDESQTLNALLEEAPQRTSLAFSAGLWSWRLPTLKLSCTGLLAPVLWSAGDLIAGSRRDRVRQCANEKCRWLFLDDSKSGTRRWCSMSSCGNRAKAHRHYLKTKSAEDGTAAAS